MDLIDRYVFEVGHYLPARLREDVQAELRSLLTESVEARARAAGRAADPALAAETLREFGRPRDVAARYAPQQQYLIGPRLYPGYVRALEIMVPVLAAVVVILIALGRFGHGGEVPALSVLARATGSFFNAVAFQAGVLTLVFALVERAMQFEKADGRPWDPATLPPVKDPDRISYFGRIGFLYLIAAVAVIFNLYPEWVGVVVFHDTDVTVYPLLRPEFGRFMPYLNGWWALTFVVTLVTLRQGHWTRVTRWAQFGLEMLNAALLAAIVAGPEVFIYDPLVKMVLAAFIGIALIRAGAQLFRLARPAATRAWQPPAS